MKASKHPTILPVSLLVSALTVMAGAAHAQAAGPKAENGYELGVFARGFGDYSAPDSIAVADGHVFIGYGNGNLPDGSDGKSSNIIEYTEDGKVVHVYTVLGHNDGLKAVPNTPYLLALQNEDANPNLVVIDSASRSQTLYNFAAPPAHGGGYDDMVIRKGKLYISASNPAYNPNDKPAIVEGEFQNGLITVSPVLEGNATATDVVTGQTVTLNLQDPDSMTLDPLGDLLMTSQADAELVLVRRPGKADQSVLQIPLTSPYGSAQADDTIFTPADDGVILVADTPANIIYAIHKQAFVPNAAYTAALAGTEGFVGRLDLGFGLLTPVVTGLQDPHGMAFLTTHNAGRGDEDDDYCSFPSFWH